MYKRILSIAAVLLTAALTCLAQTRNYQDMSQLYGVYQIYDFQDFEKPQVPRGYVPVSISHYGRHGARYQDSEEAYTKVLDPLLKAREDDALTEYGKEVCDKTEAFYALCRNRRGELTHVGWDQHRRIAHLMYRAYPSLFGRNAEVTATSSFSQRCILSMNAFGVGLKEAVPSVNLYAETSRTLLEGVNPSDKQSVSYVAVDAIESPWGMSYDEFLKQRISREEAMAVLLRIFKDEDYIRQNIASTRQYCQAAYNMISGMHCVSDELAVDDLFTEDELFGFYEVINYGFYEWGALKRNQHKPVIINMMALAEKDLQSDHPAVRLRFGHDTVLLGLMTLLDINGMGFIPEDARDLSKTWNCFNTPMAANLEFVFYRHRKSGDVLVLPLLNGKAAEIGRISTDRKVGSLYHFSDLKRLVEDL